MPAILKPILGSESWLESAAFFFVSGLVLYVLSAGSSYLYYHWLRRDRFFPASERRSDERRWLLREWGWSLFNLAGNALLIAPIHQLVLQGKSRIYVDVHAYGWGYLAFSVVLLLLVTEGLVYGAHRLLHVPWLYRHLHVHHHKFRVPSPWTGMAFHPLDSFLQSLPLHLCAFLFPVHVALYLGFLTFLQLWATFIHERVTWVTWGGLLFTAHHTVHHRFNKYNYGQFTTLFDRLFGTHRSPDGLVYDGALGAAQRGRSKPAATVQPVATGRTGDDDEVRIFT